MHALFEAGEAMRHIKDMDGLEPVTRDDISALRLGVVLTGLAAMPQSKVMSAREAWKWLKQADDADLLQVFLDTDGIGRGYAIFSMLNNDTDTLARLDPRIVSSGGCRREGSNVWITALAGGVGQGFAIAQQLKKGFLSRHAEVKYVKKVNGQPMLKMLKRVGSEPQNSQGSLIEHPEKGVRFTQLRLGFTYTKQFSQYIQLNALYKNDISLRRASENFYHAASLRQFKFDSDNAPSTYLSWCMVDQETYDRFSVEGTSNLEPGDWSCGDLRMTVETLGDLLLDGHSGLVQRR